MKDEEKTRKKQGEKGTDKWCRNYERHIDLTGWFEFVCAEELVSSHGIKRFFNVFSWPRIWLFRRLLQGLFIWRINVTKPDVIELHIDTMVMDNDEAEVRYGVEPTPAKAGVEGFQPLKMTWERFVVDAVFRGEASTATTGIRWRRWFAT